MWVKLTETLSFDFFCQTKDFSMVHNELIHKEMVECSQTSKNKEQKHKNKNSTECGVSPACPFFHKIEVNL